MNFDPLCRSTKKNSYDLPKLNVIIFIVLLFYNMKGEMSEGSGEEGNSSRDEHKNLTVIKTQLSPSAVLCNVFNPIPALPEHTVHCKTKP